MDKHENRYYYSHVRGKQYNALVYYQRCKVCNLLSKPILDDWYAEWVAYRLKKNGAELSRNLRNYRAKVKSTSIRNQVTDIWNSID